MPLTEFEAPTYLHVSKWAPPVDTKPGILTNRKEVGECCEFTAAMILSKASEPLSSMNWATELRASGLMEDKKLRWLSVNFASAFWTVL